MPLTEHLRRLEAKSIFILRETVAEFIDPVMLYSIGKDSSVMLHLALKAFYPAPAALSAATRGHHLEVPRDDLVSRPDRGAGRHGPSGACQRGRRFARRLSGGVGVVGSYAGDEDRGAASGARQVEVRRGLRRRPPRRGEEPRQGARVLASQRRPRLGPQEPAPGIVAACSTHASRRASRCACSRSPTGPNWTSGTISPPKISRWSRSISPSRARWSPRWRADHGR